MTTIGRNRPCPCGSGKKYKLCCLAKDEERAGREVADPVRTSLPPYRVIRDEPIPPEAQASAERWERFEAAGSREERIRIFREALTEASLDSDDALEMLSEIRDEGSGPEQHETFAGLLQELRARAPELYDQDVGSYNAWLIEDALERQEYEALPALLEPFARDPDRHPGQLFALIPLLMYHGQAELLLDLLRRAWPVLKKSTTPVPWAIDRYRQVLVGLVLFDYVDSAPAPRADDPTLRAALEGICELDEPVRRNLMSLLGQMPEPLRLSDFAHPGDTEALAANLARLTVEWLGELHRRHGVPLAKGELARQALLEYLGERAQEGVTGRRLLLPAAEPLSRHLHARLFEDESGAAYAVGSLLELLPRFVDWLVERGFVAAEDARHALRGLRVVHESLLRSLDDGLYNRPAIRAIEQAGRVAGEADPRPAEDAPSASSPLFARLRQAGQDPDPALLDEIKALGPAAVRPLVAMAVDERLHFADQHSPEVWAPLHAVRLLGELGAVEAVEPLLPLFEWDDDWLATALPEAYGRIGRPAFEPLRALLLDPEWDVYSRARAAEGLAKIAEHHPELRSEVVDTLVAWLDRAETRTSDDAALNGFVVGDLVDLKAVEALPAIRRAFDTGRVDQTIVDYRWVLNKLGMAPAPRTPPQPAPALVQPRTGRKIGRNEPCPCGSGRKYKKCCGR